MTPQEFRACRIAAGLSQRQWALALGYDLISPRSHISNMESGAKPISPQVARLAMMYRQFEVPKTVSELSSATQSRAVESNSAAIPESAPLGLRR